MGGGSADRKCLVPECRSKRPADCRGLCPSHRSTAKALIKKKLTTEEQLVAAGKMLPKPLTRSKAAAWFLAGVRGSTTSSSQAPGRSSSDPTAREIAERAAVIRAHTGKRS